MSDLIERLRITAGMITMCEKISWGQDSAVMQEAADALEAARELAEAMGGALEALSGPDDVAFLDIKKCSAALTKFCSKMGERE